MSHPSRRSLCFLILALFAVAAGPAFAADAPTPAVEADLVAAEAAPALTPAEPGVEGALEQSWHQQYGDCKLWCNFGQQHWYNRVTREQCCGGTLTCPDGSYPSGYAFYPYDGYAEFCSY